MSKFNRYKRSTGRFLRRAFHRPKAKISRGSIIIAVTLTIIFFASLALRLIPLIDAQPIVRAFDPWFQLKATEYVVENGYGAYFGWHDAYTWVPFGREIGRTTYVGVPFTSAFLYFAANGLGIPVSVTYVSILMPALLGALTTIAAFFLGREISNNSVGLLSALFMGFMPAFLQRTIVGFYDNECIGVFAIVLTVFFFTRSIKRNSLPSAVGAGLSLAYLLSSWGAADFLLDLFALYAFLLLVAGRYSKRLLSSYLTTVSIGMFIGGLVPRNGFNNLTQFSTLVPIGVAALLAIYEIWLRVESYRESTAEALSPHMKPILLAIGAPVIAATSYFIYASGSELDISTANANPILTIGGKFLTVINPFYRLDQRIFASVAEHMPTPWSSFYNTLLVLVFFFPLGMYFAFKRGKDEDWLIILYGVTAVYFAGSMIRLGLILAPGVAVLSAIAVNQVLTPFSRIFTQQSVFERRRLRMSSSLTSEHALAAYVFVGLLLSMTIFGGVNYSTNQAGRPEFASGQISTGARNTDWQTAMNFIRNVLPSTATIASWWDYGYWINSAGGAQTIVDNSTHNATQIALMGYAMMARNLTASLETFKKWNTSHVLVYWGHRVSGFGGDEGKWPWMVRIAEDRLGSAVIDDKTYLGDNPDTSQTETDYTLNAFFETTLYKLMLYGEPRSEEELAQMNLPESRQQADMQYLSDQNNPDTRWKNNAPQNLHGAFDLVFTSGEYGLVKIYEIDYTMLEQYQNKLDSDWPIEKGTLNVDMNGNVSASEQDFASFEVVFGGGYEATVYTRANGTHVYFGIEMDQLDVENDAFGIQLSDLGTISSPDIRVVNYDGHDYFDGYVSFEGDWVPDSSDSTPSEYAIGNRTVEFLLPLNSSDPQDLRMIPGMNYQIRFLFWDNIQSGEPTFAAPWTTFWVPVDLY